MNIISIDNETPSLSELTEIKNSTCIQCKKYCDDNEHIMYTRLLSTKEIIWWHTKKYPWETAPCKYKSTERSHRKKQLTNKELIKKYDFLSPTTRKKCGKIKSDK